LSLSGPAANATELKFTFLSFFRCICIYHESY